MSDRFGENLLQSDTLPKILLMGVPECGLNMLYDTILELPNLSPGIWLNQWAEDVYANLATLQPGEVRAGYVYYNGELRRYLDDKRIRRVFIVRDPRDMIISYLNFILSTETHIHHPYFTKHLKSTEERLMKLIAGFTETREISRQYGLESIGYGNVNYHYIRYLRWMKDPNCCVVRYENLNRDDAVFRKEIERIAAYLWDSAPSQLEIPAMRRIAAEHWRELFTPEISSLFKEVSGELLIHLGYENDMQW